jgi:hypothetical protein
MKISNFIFLIAYDETREKGNYVLTVVTTSNWK